MDKPKKMLDHVMVVFSKEMRWSECWGDGMIGNGLKAGVAHGPSAALGLACDWEGVHMFLNILWAYLITSLGKHWIF